LAVALSIERTTLSEARTRRFSALSRGAGEEHARYCMAPLRLTLALNDTEFVRPLKEGTIRPEGIELTVLTHMRTPEMVERMIRHEFDGAEMGLNFAVTAAARGAPEGLIALPIFPLRRFCHGVVFFNTSAGIARPQDLVGKTIGNIYPAAGNVWTRGILQEHYGVGYRSVQWVSVDWELQHLTPAWHRRAPSGEVLESMLQTGEIAALIRSYVSPSAVRADPRIAYLFPDYRAHEIAYFRQTGVFPILHTLMMKRELVEAHPWIAQSLVRAFDEARTAALRRAIDPRVVFARAVGEEQEDLLGSDPWTNGLSDRNRTVLETFLRHAHDQEMIERPMAVDDVFAPS
jgi:4,5-dihydroxyphthalate decarboxylase